MPHLDPVMQHSTFDGCSLIKALPLQSFC